MVTDLTVLEEPFPQEARLTMATSERASTAVNLPTRRRQVIWPRHSCTACFQVEIIVAEPPIRCLLNPRQTLRRIH